MAKSEEKSRCHQSNLVPLNVQNRSPLLPKPFVIKTEPKNVAEVSPTATNSGNSKVVIKKEQVEANKSGKEPRNIFEPVQSKTDHVTIKKETVSDLDRSVSKESVPSSDCRKDLDCKDAPLLPKTQSKRRSSLLFKSSSSEPESDGAIHSPSILESDGIIRPKKAVSNPCSKSDLVKLGKGSLSTSSKSEAKVVKNTKKKNKQKLEALSQKRKLAQQRKPLKSTSFLGSSDDDDGKGEMRKKKKRKSRPLSALDCQGNSAIKKVRQGSVERPSSSLGVRSAIEKMLTIKPSRVRKCYLIFFSLFYCS